MRPQDRAKAIQLIISQQPRVNPDDIEDMSDDQLIESALGELEAAIEEIERLNSNTID